MKKIPYYTFCVAAIVMVFFLNVQKVKAQGEDYVRSQPANTNNTENKKFSLSLSLGAAIPLLDFGSTNVKNSFWDQTSVDSTHLQGFAKPGIHFDFRLSYFITDFFGMTVLLGGNLNNFDINTFKSAADTAGVNAATTNYFTGEYLIGPVFSLPLNNKLKLRASILGGFMKNSYPQLTLKVNDTINVTIAMNSANFSFAFCFDVNLTYSINDYLEFNAGISYTQSTIHYPGWVQTFNVTSTNPAYYYLPLTINHTNDVTYMVTGLLKPCIGIAVKF